MPDFAPELRLACLIAAVAVAAPAFGDTQAGASPNPADGSELAAPTTNLPTGPAPTYPTLSGPTATWFPPRLVTPNLIALPKMYYSQEAGVGFGGKMQYTMLSDSGPSTLELSGRYTTKGQAKAQLVGLFQPWDGPYSLKTKFSYSTLGDRFWGVGSDTSVDQHESFQARQTLGYAELFRHFGPRLQLGLRAEVENQQYLQVEEGGELDAGGQVGTAGGMAVGLGLSFAVDARDNPWYPTRGFYYQGFAMFFDPTMGSTYSFNQYHVDLRHYLRLHGSHVLAFQMFGYSARGDGAPVWRYAQMGGRVHSRGYRRGRFTDRNLVAFQAEYRFPVLWRFEGSAFAGLADVADHYRNFSLGTMHPTVGGGVRARLDEDGRKFARFDIAVGQESLRLYLDLGISF